MSNPFFLTPIPDDDDICDRHEDLNLLLKRAESNTMVVLYSPRRYGKTSLARQAQKRLRGQGWLTVHVDLFGVTSMEEVARRIAREVYQAIHASKDIFSKAGKALAGLAGTFFPTISYSPIPGQDIKLSLQKASPEMDQIQLLEGVMDDIARLIEKVKGRVHLVFDEFQEIESAGAERTEKILRSHMQFHKAPYLILGSRQHLLLNMFRRKNRAFYNMALLMRLDKLPEVELASYIVERFAKGGKHCTPEVAQKIVRLARRHPYYTQKLAYLAFELAEEEASSHLIGEALKSIMAEQSHLYAADIRMLAPGQLELLKQIALREPAQVHSKEFLKRSGLLSGTVSKALKKLISYDFVELGEDKAVRLTDPLFARWLSEKA
jgi:AAA+ ATPase superfamily predicted ATPase